MEIGNIDWIRILCYGIDRAQYTGSDGKGILKAHPNFYYKQLRSRSGKNNCFLNDLRPELLCCLYMCPDKKSDTL